MGVEPTSGTSQIRTSTHIFRKFKLRRTTEGAIEFYFDDPPPKPATTARFMLGGCSRPPLVFVRLGLQGVLTTPPVLRLGTIALSLRTRQLRETLQFHLTFGLLLGAC